LQQARQYVLAHDAAGQEAAHVAPFRDHAIDGPPLLGTECLLAHRVIVENPR